MKAAQLGQDPRDPSGPAPLPADPDILSVDAARAAIAAEIRPVASRTQAVPLVHALGRVLADDVVSPMDVPAHDNSAMDGYAFDGASVQPGRETVLRVVGVVLAGESYDRPVQSGECVRIMTGAAMPPSLDTVVPIELCRADGEQVAHCIRDSDGRRQSPTAR